jgi:hypothetical protein
MNLAKVRQSCQADGESHSLKDELAVGTFFERTLQKFTNSYLHRKLLNFCKKQS